MLSLDLPGQNRLCMISLLISGLIADGTVSYDSVELSRSHGVGNDVLSHSRRSIYTLCY